MRDEGYKETFCSNFLPIMGELYRRMIILFEEKYGLKAFINKKAFESNGTPRPEYNSLHVFDGEKAKKKWRILWKKTNKQKLMSNPDYN